MFWSNVPRFGGELRSFFSSLALVVALLPLGPAFVASAAEPSPPPSVRPNILLIMTDDQGYGEMSCHGNPILVTPHLDRLHRESVRFTDFHVSPTCSPTRTALMTGRHEFRSGVTHTILERERMSLRATTLAQVLKQAGYRTGIFGKWHLGDEAEYQPERRGFDEVFIHGAGGIGQTYPGSCGDAPHNSYFHPAILHNGRYEKTTGFCTDVFFAQAQKWIHQQRESHEPWFAYVTPNAPHGPYHAPPDYAARFQNKGLSADAIGYYAMIANIDDNVGRTLDRLREWNLERRTLVIFLTDNGHAVGSVYNAGMRGTKGTPYQGGTRVPSFWRWPGTLPAGVDVARLTGHVDILPTLAELAGAKLPNAPQSDAPKLDGRSLVPLLKNAQAPWDDRFLFTHLGRWNKGQAVESKFKNCAVRTSRFRLVNNRELFDIQADPGETQNVFDQHPEAVAAMRAAYDRWWEEILPALENEDAVGPAVNPFKALYWKQFGGGPESSSPTATDGKPEDSSTPPRADSTKPSPEKPSRPALDKPAEKPAAKPRGKQQGKNKPAAKLAQPLADSRPERPRPNILWITSEDHGPHLGCYGDAYATTPTADQFAARSLTYRRVWSNAPVCAPARTTLITGLYPPSLGAEHMRSMVPLPVGMQLYPQLLRDAGYYCTNNAKEDYNVAASGDAKAQPWDESSKKAHWQNRPAGRPFLAVFNSEKSHESRLRSRPHEAQHDPAKVRVPAYHPDTPEVRQDWAQYYDQVSAADADAALRLEELAAAGLADDTIVFYFADHGSGMPRNKRWIYDSGLHVPLIVHVPEKFRHLAPDDYRPGGSTDRLVSFVDFAPTLLSLAGVRPPAWMQGEAFLGEFSEPPRTHLYGFRGRMDERYDLARSATDGRFVYIRHYAPHRIYGQHVGYMFQTPTTRVWKRLHDEGRLNAAQDRFWNAKPYEELYDLRNDPDEVRDLAADPTHRQVLDELRAALDGWQRSIRDVGLLPEGEMHRRAAGDSPYELARDERRYPFERIFAAAQRAARRDPAALPELRRDLSDAQADSAVRYWSALGVAMLGKDAILSSRVELQAALRDPSPDVRIAAAESLARHGGDEDRTPALALLAQLARWSDDGSDVFTALSALQALDDLGPLAAPLAPSIRKLPVTGPAPHPRYKEYVPRLVERFAPAG